MVRRIKRETFYMFILLLVLLPQPTVALNCQMACDSCYDDSEDPPLREVYCSMCEECLSAKHMNEPKDTRFKPLRPSIQEKSNKQPLRYQEYGWDNQEQGQGMYPDCPTAPPCPEEDEEEYMKKEEISKEEVISGPNCPNPYMPPCLPLCPPPAPRPTCPPIIPCKPKKLKPNKKRPKQKRPNQPMMPPWCWPFPQHATSNQDQEKLKDTTKKDFVYVYVGVPKGVIAKDTNDAS